MRTFYYNISVIRSNGNKIAEQCGYEYSRSVGILKIEYSKGKIQNIEGLLNLDYIGSNISEDKIEIIYFIPSENFHSLREDFRIVTAQDKIKKPFNYYGGNNNYMVQIDTISKITDDNIKNIMILN